MNHVKNQHIVPEFLLRNFSSNNHSHIWSFDKSAIKEKWNNEKNRVISSAPTETYFYDKIIGTAEGSYEYVLGQNETEVAPIISKLLSTRNIDKLTLQDKMTIAKFICFQMFRTKELLNFTKKSSEKFYKRFADFTGEEIQPNARELWLKILNKKDLYKNFIFNKTWVLAESKDEFYLSDNPVVLQNTSNHSEHRGTLGINSLGIEIYIPLSSSVLLGLFCNKTVPIQIPNINCLPAHIENLNWLQIDSSTRFVFAKTNSFDLIYEMMKENKI